MKRVTFIAAALVLAFLAVLAGRVTAQETNTSERTFLTFSSAVEMPGLTLQPGTYVFKLADTPTRNVVQVWDNDEKNMLGHWLFVQAERPEVTSETVVMFKEEPAGATPAVQYWYFPGERIGKEFIYPKDQALKIAQRTGIDVRTEDGVVEGGGLASIEQANADVSPQADSTLSNAPAAAQPSAAAGSLAGNRGVTPQADADVDVDVDVDRDADVSARANVPAPVQEQAPARQGAVGTSGSAEAQVARADELPQTSSPLALSGLIGLLSLAGAFALRSIR
jgi:hypothetical protein